MSWDLVASLAALPSRVAVVFVLSNDPGVATTGRFNTYALMCARSTRTVYFNGVPKIVSPYRSDMAGPDTAPEPFNQPFFLAFTAVPGVDSDSFEASTTPLPAMTRINWVRVRRY